jgi:hypothetical protein
LESLRADVEALSAIERRAGTPGDRASAEWVAARMREAGVEDVRIEPFRCHSTWAIPYGAHNLLGLLAARLPAPLRVPLALATAISFESDYVGRDQTLRSLVPGAGTGHNVVGRIPPTVSKGPDPLGRRNLVLVAHHDAAHTGWVWDPRLLAGGRNYARRTGTTPSFIGLQLLALLLVALGARRAGSALLSLGLALGAQSALSETVPGASDNATGVAGILELARRLAADPLEDTEVTVLAPSGEEVGLAGMYQWLHVSKGSDPLGEVLVLGLDTLGAGEPVVARGESFTGRYREEDVALAGDVPRVVLGAGTDPMVARQAGLPAVSILSWTDGGFTNYHRPTDTADRVSWESVERCVEVADRTIRRWHAATPAPSS